MSGTKTEQSSLDSRVLLAISQGHKTFSAIDQNSRRIGEGSFRTTDRILQRLRRRGTISFSHRNGWSVSKA